VVRLRSERLAADREVADGRGHRRERDRHRDELRASAFELGERGAAVSRDDRVGFGPLRLGHTDAHAAHARAEARTEAASRRRQRGQVSGSRGSVSLATASRKSARSTELAAMGPMWPTEPLRPSPSRLTRPKVGLMPKRPCSAAGMRTEPPPSVPTAKGATPSATPTAEPVEEPPGTRSACSALCGMIERSFWPSGDMPHSVITVLATMIAPAARRRATTAESWSFGSVGSQREPMPVGSPSASSSSFKR
jgi:hypothetical protein